MKFQNIPQYKNSHYQVSIPLRSVPETLKRWKKDQQADGYDLILNPDFQRGHVWTTKQQSAYIQWLLRGGTSGRDIYFNHPRWDIDWKADMVCVDGLQRLTAIQRFLNNEIVAFGYFYEEFEDKINNLNMLNFHVGSYSEIEAIEWYLEMNYAGTPHTQDELNRVFELLMEKRESQT